MSIPVYVISLARATSRRENIIRRLDAAEVSYEIIDAVDGESLQPHEYEHRLNEKAARFRYKIKMTKGQLGCYLSHYRIWQKMVAEQIPCALVLEDDAVWDDDFFDIVQRVKNCAWVWNVVLLSSETKHTTKQILSEFDNGRKLVNYPRPAWTTAAYLIDLEGAVKLKKHAYKIVGWCDAVWRELYKNKLAFYHIQPPIAWHSGVSSLLGYGSEIKPFTKLEKIARAIMKKWRRYRHRFFQPTHPPKRKR